MCVLALVIWFSIERNADAAFCSIRTGTITCPTCVCWGCSCRFIDTQVDTVCTFDSFYVRRWKSLQGFRSCWLHVGVFHVCSHNSNDELPHHIPLMHLIHSGHLIHLLRFDRIRKNFSWLWCRRSPSGAINMKSVLKHVTRFSFTMTQWILIRSLKILIVGRGLWPVSLHRN